MARLPFDDPPRPSPGRRPQRAASVDASASGGASGALTVSQAASLVKEVLAAHLPAPLTVVGEISNFSNRTHWFFSLKDAAATLRCVCFATAARKVRFNPADGMQVVASGRIDYFPGQGQLQLYVDRLEPVGVGALELQLRALVTELRELGYFDEQRKKPLPLVPAKVAVITSRSGAALQDVINTAGRRWRGCRLCLLDVHVQGAAAAPEIAATIDALSRHGQRLGIEAVILTRGGGSIEDLWAFNERIVADAVYNCALPIVAAIGHETDTTVAELVADRRAATPTQAVMMLLPDQAALAHQVQQIRARLSLLTRRNVSQARQHLHSLARHAMFRRPQLALAPLRQRLEAMAGALGTALPRRARAARLVLDALGPRLLASLPRRLHLQQQHLAGLGRQLQAINPRRVLERGYSYTIGPDGRVLRSAAAVRAEDRITTVLADGRLTSRVEGDQPDHALSPPRTPSITAPPRRRRSAAREDDPSLFG